MNDSSAATMALQPSAALSVEEVLEVRHWNERLFSFSITRPASFRFRSGEFVMIGLPGDGKPILRAYSLASPAWAEHLEFLSIKVDDGPLTSKLQKIVPGDHIYLGRKPTGTLVLDALVPGRRLFLLSSGTGLAPFLSVIRDPETYQMFEQVLVVHSVRQVSDLAYREQLEAKLADDPLVADEAAAQLHYLPTVTREPFPTGSRIDVLVADGRLFAGLEGPARFDPETDRVMLCGSMHMIRDLSALLDGFGLREGSNAHPGHYVIEKAFVG